MKQYKLVAVVVIAILILPILFTSVRSQGVATIGQQDSTASQDSDTSKESSPSNTQMIFNPPQSLPEKQLPSGFVDESGGTVPGSEPSMAAQTLGAQPTSSSSEPNMPSSTAIAVIFRGGSGVDSSIESLIGTPELRSLDAIGIPNTPSAESGPTLQGGNEQPQEGTPSDFTSPDIPQGEISGTGSSEPPSSGTPVASEDGGNESVASSESTTSSEGSNENNEPASTSSVQASEQSEENIIDSIFKGETGAPTITQFKAIEKAGKRVKRVEISSTVGGTNVPTLATVPTGERVPVNQIRIYHIINGVRVDITQDPSYRVKIRDTNGDGFIDDTETITWETPHLSTQTFEIDLGTTSSGTTGTGTSGSTGTSGTQCTPTSGQELTETSCQDGIDNDCDGLIDGADGDCSTPAGTTNAVTTSSSPTDSDGDGLPDSWENQYAGLDPAKSDTDGDGVLDGDEDPDSDQLTNIFEYFFGTDPTNSDSDGDNLDDNYEFLNSIRLPDVFFNVMGSSPPSFFTNPKESFNPNNLDTDGDGLNDFDEISYGTYPNDTDHDLDGLSDGDEIYTYGTDPINPDTDGDTIKDGDEVANVYNGLSAPTNPNSIDSDGDTIGDYAESQTIYNGISAPTNPASSDTDNDLLQDNDEITNTYNNKPAATDPTNPDTDSDGLSDGDEVYQYLTNPSDHDTDNDNMPDGWEVQYSLNPKDASDANLDPDNDGISNADEFLAGTNPTGTDSDSDGMPDAWETQYNLDPLDSSDATDDGDTDGLSNLDEYTAGTDPTSSDSDGDGLKDGSEVNYIYNGVVTPTDPTNPDTDGDRLNDKEEAFVKYQRITQGVGYIKFTPTDPTDPDTDSDGLTDYEEAKTYSTNPINSDSDGDGVEDYDEVNTHSTDPNNPDSDGDGLSDGDEVNTHSTDPNNPDSDGDGLKDNYEVNVLQTDPNNLDSDSDSLNDYDEVNVHLTNPNEADSDNDGLSDYDEITNIYNGNPAPTNPNNLDTDGDGLSDGDEVHNYHTNPRLKDTDGGKINDKDEIDLGKDPLDPFDDFGCVAILTHGESYAGFNTNFTVEHNVKRNSINWNFNYVPPQSSGSQSGSGAGSGDGQGQDSGSNSGQSSGSESNIPSHPTPVCGNGIVEGGEECDGANGCPQDYQCRSDCTGCDLIDQGGNPGNQNTFLPGGTININAVANAPNDKFIIEYKNKYTTVGEYTAQVSVYNSSCTAEDTTEVEVKCGVQASIDNLQYSRYPANYTFDITGTAKHAVEGATVTASGTITPADDKTQSDTLSWSGPDSDGAVEANTFLEATGIYNLTLIATDRTICSQTATKQITIDHGQPHAVIDSPSSTQIDAGDQVQFKESSFDLDGDIVEWAWDFGDETEPWGTLATIQNKPACVNQNKIDFCSGEENIKWAGSSFKEGEDCTCLDQSLDIYPGSASRSDVAPGLLLHTYASEDVCGSDKKCEITLTVTDDKGLTDMASTEVSFEIIKPLVCSDLVANSGTNNTGEENLVLESGDTKCYCQDGTFRVSASATSQAVGGQTYECSSEEPLFEEPTPPIVPTPDRTATDFLKPQESDYSGQSIIAQQTGKEPKDLSGLANVIFALLGLTGIVGGGYYAHKKGLFASIGSKFHHSGKLGKMDKELEEPSSEAQPALTEQPAEPQSAQIPTEPGNTPEIAAAKGPNPLTNYVQQARASGMDDEQIKQVLSAHGWTDEQIEEAITNNQ